MTAAPSQHCIELNSIISASQSVNKEQRDQATAQIQTFKLDSATVQALLEFITTESLPRDNRLAVALILKNILKKVYGQHSYSHYDAAIQKRKEQEQLTNDEDDPSNFIDNEGLAILQQHLISLLMGCPDEKITALLLESVSLMSKRFVQKEWPTLITELCAQLEQQQSPQNMKRSLQAIKNICKKYRFMFRSDDLYREMNYMIEKLSPLLLSNICFACSQLQQSQQMGAEALEQVKTMVSIINSVLHIYESILSQEELPDFYEENLGQISQVCVYVLETDFAQLQELKDIQLLYKTRAKVVRLAILYQFKFSEYFEGQQDTFFSKIWEQVSQQKVVATRECKTLIFAIVSYLGDCANMPKYKEFIGQNLQALFQVLVLPNISLTEQDLEEYECESAQYIKNDLEESDAETRRRVCMKFVTKLSTVFEQQVSALIGQFITSMQAEYASDKQQHWLKAVTIINLIITASISCYTYQHGATEVRITSELLETYLQQLIVPELQIQAGMSLDNLPILRATCIKFVYMFRNQIPDNYVLEFVKLLTDYLKSEQEVNQSYAAACIEKLLIKKKQAQSNKTVLDESNMPQEILSKLLQNLCELLNNNQDLYAMRGLLRVVQLSKQGIVPFAATLGQVLSHFISEVVRDTQVSPNYTYILFEAAALSLTYTKQDPEAFALIENQLTPILNGIIQSGQSEYVGYGFQLYATFIASSQTMKPDYDMLCTSILDQNSIQTNWGREMKYLIPALGTFLTTFMCKYPEQAAQKLANIQTIITHLLKPDVRMEQVALKLCSCVFERLGQAPLQDNGTFLQSVLVAIFTSLHFYRNNTRSQVIPASIMKAVHIFFANFMVCHGSLALLNACNAVQPSSLFMVLNSESKAIVHVSSPTRDRKYVLVAYARCLAEFCDQMPFETVQALTSGLIELASQTTSGGFVTASSMERNVEDLLMDGAVDKTFAFNRQQFVQLTAAKIEQIDQLATEVVITNEFVMNCFQETTKKLNQSVSNLLLKPQHGTALQALVEDTGIALT